MKPRASVDTPPRQRTPLSRPGGSAENCLRGVSERNQAGDTRDVYLAKGQLEHQPGIESPGFSERCLFVSTIHHQLRLPNHCGPIVTAMTSSQAPPSLFAYSSSMASAYFSSGDRGSSWSTPSLRRESGDGRCAIFSFRESARMCFSSWRGSVSPKSPLLNGWPRNMVAYLLLLSLDTRCGRGGGQDVFWRRRASVSPTWCFSRVG